MTRRQVPVLAALGALAIGAVLIAVVILGSPRSQPTPVAQASPTFSATALASPTDLAPTPIPTSNPLAGALDPTFMAGLGAPGYIFVESRMPAGATETHANLATDAQGRIYVEIAAAYQSHLMNADEWLRLARYTDAGPDPTFQPYHADAQDDTGSNLIGPVLTKNGVAVEFDNFFMGPFFLRLTATGADDTPRFAFVPNPVGGGMVGFSGDAIGQPDGSMRVCLDNDPSFRSPTSVSVVALLPSGQLDKAYGASGFAGLGLWTCRALVADNDGAIIVAGDTGTATVPNLAVGIQRLSSTGVQDPTFGPAGIATAPYQHAALLQRGLLFTPDGSILVGLNVGDTGPNVRAVLARFTGKGIADTSFGVAGLLELTPVGQACRLTAMAVQSDGRILVATACQSDASTTRELVRLLPDGTGDPTFGTNGHRVVNEAIAAMVVLPTGELLGVSVLDDGRVSLWRRLL
jgi:uncharacterized delta-60 repeat protein